jgi:prephenate dehydrogenase
MAYLVSKLSGYLIKDIARYFRQKPMTMSQAIIKVEDLLQRGEDLAKRVSVMESHLTEKRKRKYLISII